MDDKHFVIRVYALIINDNNEVLLSDEYVLDTYMVKFPGGGLEWGEGTMDCLKREAMEEFGQEIEITGHFYTTDFFQEALFYENTQLISIYYFARFTDAIKFKISQKPFDFIEGVNGSQSFRWKNIADLNPDEFTFPIDKKVGEMLLRR
jgi:ADP-ribose pyrophosphatase YjhB (NUDIX family)